MSDRALKFVETAEKYANNRKALSHDGENIADRIVSLAERMSKLDARVVSDEDRELYLARIWSAYGEVTDYLESGAAYNIGIPESPLYGEMLSDIAGIEAANADWDGCVGQVIVDNDYEGWEAAMN